MVGDQIHLDELLAELRNIRSHIEIGERLSKVVEGNLMDVHNLFELIDKQMKAERQDGGHLIMLDDPYNDPYNDKEIESNRKCLLTWYDSLGCWVAKDFKEL